MIDWECIESLILKDGQKVTIKAAGTSMYPHIMSGDKLTLSPISSNEKIDSLDILFIRSEGKYFIHRYIEEHGKTKGDNNSSFDPPADQIIARVSRIKKTPESILKRIRFQIQRLIMKAS